MAMLEFPVPPALNVLELGAPEFDVNPSQYSISNPHPGFGKDPNIINEFGHTAYPKYVYPAGEGAQAVLVQDAAEEAKVLGVEVKAPKAKKTDNGWTE